MTTPARSEMLIGMGEKELKKTGALLELYWILRCAQDDTVSGLGEMMMPRERPMPSEAVVTWG